MAKKKLGRALAGLAALGTMGAVAAGMSSRPASGRRIVDILQEEQDRRGPVPTGGRRIVDILQEEQDRRGPVPTGGRRAMDILQEQEDRRGPVPDVTDVIDAEQARIFKGIPGVRTSTGIPVRSGDGLLQTESFKKGGAVKSRGSASSASRRGDGIAIRGKTKGRML